MFEADKRFINGRIYTMTGEGGAVSALACFGGKIVACGSDRDILDIPAKETIDLAGRTVLPGFIDTHCHMAEVAEGSRKIDLTQAASISEVLELLRTGLETLSPGQWLTGYQISAASLKEKRLPDRYDLDKVSDTVPIFLSSNCLHNFMVNSPALALSGIGRSFDVPERRLVEFDESGEPTGRLREHGALQYINAVRPTVLQTQEERLESLQKALMDFSRNGFTTIHSFDGFDGSVLDGAAGYQALEREGRLPMRVVLNRQHAAENTLGAISGFGNEKIKYGAVKFFTDGCFSQRSACLLESYGDLEGAFGIPIYKDETYLQMVKKAYDGGNDIAIHVIGDGGMAQVLKIIESIYDPSRQQQFRLIHVTLSTPEQWERLAKLPVLIDTQPAFMPAMGAVVAPRLGGDERVRNIMALKSMTDRGILVTGGDDAPISPHKPFVGIRYAVLREVEFGGERLNPAEGLSVYEAVRLYTANAAYCAHEEALKGTIAVGKLADFIVLDRDIFDIPAQEISEISVLKSYLGGEAVC